MSAATNKVVMRESLREAAEEIDRLRKALRFYANRNNWTGQGQCYVGDESYGEYDEGHLARRVLGLAKDFAEASGKPWFR